MHREGRAEDDGYQSALLPGVHASAMPAVWPTRSRSPPDGCWVAAEPPGAYAEARALAEARSGAGHVDLLPDLLLLPARLLRRRGPLRGRSDGAGSRPRGGRPRGRGAAISTTSRWVRAPRTIPRAGPPRWRPTGIGPSRAAVRPARSPAIPDGPPSGALNGCSSASRSPASGAWDAMTCSSRSGASACMSCARAPCACRAWVGCPRATSPRWPPSACSRSAIRCCSSAARPRSREAIAVPWKRSISRWPTGALRRGRRSDFARR